MQLAVHCMSNQELVMLDSHSCGNYILIEIPGAPLVPSRPRYYPGSKEQRDKQLFLKEHWVEHKCGYTARNAADFRSMFIPPKPSDCLVPTGNRLVRRLPPPGIPASLEIDTKTGRFTVAPQLDIFLFLNCAILGRRKEPNSFCR
jgi:hypothetical protein